MVLNSQRAVMLDDLRNKIVEMLVAFRKASIVEHRVSACAHLVALRLSIAESVVVSQMQTSGLAKELSELEAQCNALEEDRLIKVERMGKLEQEVKVMENELHALAQQSAMKVLA